MVREIIDLQSDTGYGYVIDRLHSCVDRYECGMEV